MQRLTPFGLKVAIGENERAAYLRGTVAATKISSTGFRASEEPSLE